MFILHKSHLFHSFSAALHTFLKQTSKMLHQPPVVATKQYQSTILIKTQSMVYIKNTFEYIFNRLLWFPVNFIAHPHFNWLDCAASVNVNLFDLTLTAQLLRDNRKLISLRRSEQLRSVPANFGGQLSDHRDLNRKQRKSFWLQATCWVSEPVPTDLLYRLAAKLDFQNKLKPIKVWN